MTAAAVLRAGRRAAERLMVDVCTIVEVDRTNPTRDPDTGAETYPETVIYTGKCRVQRYDGQSSTETGVVGRTVIVDRLAVHVPADTTGILQDHLVRVTTSRHAPSLEGSEFRVAMAHDKSHATARRLVVEETTG